MAGLRLNLSSGMSRYSPLDPIPTSSRTTPTNSASLANAERKIKELQEDNKSLRSELREIQSLYNQLIHEGKHENYDERRVNLLKAQMIQLEKQVLLLSEGLASRSAALLEMQNEVIDISNICSSLLANSDRVGSVTVSRDDVNSILRKAQAAMGRLNKCVERGSGERFERPLVFTSPCLKNEQVTMLDICSGNLHHLNLKHVAKLESKLAQLYGHLHSINECLCPVLRPAGKEVPQAVYTRLAGHISKTHKHMQQVLPDLLHLSVLVPAAPWPVLKRPINKEMTVEDIMHKLPSMSKAKEAEAERTILALVKAYNYQMHMAKLQARSRDEELCFHQSLYDLQLDYTMELMDAISAGYHNFEEETNRLICEPLNEVLRVYSSLKQTSSEDSLRYFLQAFREHEAALSNAVESLTSHAQQDKQSTFSTFGQQFLESLEKRRKDCAKKRDRLSNDISNIKEENKTHLAAMKDYFSQIDDEEEREVMEDLMKNNPKDQGHRTGVEKFVVVSYNENGVETKSSRVSKKKQRPSKEQYYAENKDESVVEEVGTLKEPELPEWNFSTTVDKSEEFVNETGVQKQRTEYISEDYEIDTGVKHGTKGERNEFHRGTGVKMKSKEANIGVESTQNDRQLLDTVPCTCEVENHTEIKPDLKQKPPKSKPFKEKTDKKMEGMKRSMSRTKLVLKPKSKNLKKSESLDSSEMVKKDEQVEEKAKAGFITVHNAVEFKNEHIEEPQRTQSPKVLPGFPRSGSASSIAELSSEPASFRRRSGSFSRMFTERLMPAQGGRTGGGGGTSPWK